MDGSSPARSAVSKIPDVSAFGMKGAEKLRQQAAAAEAATRPFREAEESARRAAERSAAESARLAEESIRPIREAAEAAAERQRRADERQERIATALESGNLARTRQFGWTLSVAIGAALIALAGLIVAVIALH